MGIPLRVLIVEDSEDDVALLLRELRRGGYDLTFERVDTPGAMKTALDKQTWDLVIADYSMPHFSAPDALALLHKRALDLPFIIVSGNIGEDIAVAAMKAGAHDYLMKGTLARLLPAIERELREAEGRRERKRAEEALWESQEQVRQYAAELEKKVEVRTRELRELNQQLEAASRHKSEFISHVSHDLRTPLTSIKGYIDNLLDRIAGDITEKQKDYLDRMSKNAGRLIRLINDLLDVSRIESGKLELNLASLSLQDLIEEVVIGLRPMAAEKHLQLVLNKLNGESQLSGDRDKLEQAIINLLDNAMKFTPPTGQITITLQRDQRFLETSIKDTGTGIPPEEQSRIFDRFHRIDRDPLSQAEGTGLGLFITKTIIELHGGHIWVVSDPGKGSEFIFTLPMTP